jgi:hypothetical protein
MPKLKERIIKKYMRRLMENLDEVLTQEQIHKLQKKIFEERNNSY